jgi:hypothetical protein
VLSLLSNAFTFTPNGGRIRISLRADSYRRFLHHRCRQRTERAGRQAARGVRAFPRIGNGGARRYPGTGYGLSIARDFAHLLDGRVTLDDAPKAARCSSSICRRRRRPVVLVHSRIAEPTDTREAGALVAALREHRPITPGEPHVSEGSAGVVLVIEDNRDPQRLHRGVPQSRGVHRPHRVRRLRRLIATPSRSAPIWW